MLKGTLLTVIFALYLALPGAAIAGPIADFEAALRAAYAEYRAALFQTNRKDKAATEAALGAFLTDWRQIIANWNQKPPPHMSEDNGFNQTLAKVESIALLAHKEVVVGELGKAHETLEAIREEIGGLRERSGLISFSDRMNAYHERMELVLERPRDSLDAAAIGVLREDAAILNYLVESISRHAPNHVKHDPKFGSAFAELKRSVDALSVATRAGDPAATKKAIQELKGPYSRMFLQFG